MHVQSCCFAEKPIVFFFGVLIVAKALLIHSSCACVFLSLAGKIQIQILVNT